MKTKILFYGDPPQNATGFGTVARNILMPLYKTGNYDIEMLAVNYWGDPHDYPFKMWPMGFNPVNDPFGRQKAMNMITEMDFDILFLIQDSFITQFVKDLIPEIKKIGKKFKSVIYFPIDGIPDKKWVEAMSVTDCPVTYTQFGYNECIKAYPKIADKLQIIPHGINVLDFHPLHPDLIEEKKALYFGEEVAEKFIITNINRNQQRKDLPRTILAFREFHKKYPDSVLYLHCQQIDGGYNLKPIIENFGLKFNKEVILPSNYTVKNGFPIKMLNRIYNFSDILISSTRGEGWGLAQVEAMAAKTSVISPDNTACTEIVGTDRGLLVESGGDVEHLIIGGNDNEVVRPLVNVQKLFEAIETLYLNQELKNKLVENAYNWVINNLTWDKHIAPQWEKIFSNLRNK